MAKDRHAYIMALDVAKHPHGHTLKSCKGALPVLREYGTTTAKRAAERLEKHIAEQQDWLFPPSGNPPWMAPNPVPRADDSEFIERIARMEQANAERRREIERLGENDLRAKSLRFGISVAQGEIERLRRNLRK